MECAPALAVSLLDGFELRVDGGPVAVARGSQRLLAFLAVNDGDVSRDHLFATLWPESDRGRAGGNLRSVLWRLPPVVRGAVVSGPGDVRLRPDVRCDVAEFVGFARGLIDGSVPADAADLLALNHDLLPTWYDDWVLLERERLRRLRMQALESLAATLSAAGRFGEAIDAALLAIAAEPLRECGHSRLIEAHRDEGNQTEAIRHYEQYRRLLDAELGVEPSAELRRLAYGPGPPGRDPQVTGG
jgi:DNA-binding SARP family transcriptional activator